MHWYHVLTVAILAVLVKALRWFLQPFFIWLERKADKSSPFVVDSTGRREEPVQLSQAPSFKLSLVIPAYNEEQRLPKMLEETIEYLERRRKRDPKYTYEFVVANDGSKDKTVQVALDAAALHPGVVLRVIDRSANRGKGGAVKTGAMYARGEYVLMVDADGATRISDLEALERKMAAIEKDGFGVVVGSRNHLVDDAVAKRKWYRNILMHGFHFLVSTVCGSDIQDTQCGFKLFTRKSAQYLFPNQETEHWAFDVELLYLARKFKMPVAEVPVNWEEIAGSKLNVVEATLSMARDLVLIQAFYMLGVWKASNTISVGDKKSN
eukprot:GILJ01001774.1.p1 GENE.GILJ01001774.1~~GILJ01001774.1.p1  ORF type:complete len:355 (+),score=64.73 GILJ01001774.1:99-1067(+)